MKIKSIGSPTLQSLYNEEDSDTLLTYRFTVDVKLYDDGDRRIDRKPNSFPEKPFTYLDCLELDALNEEYAQTTQLPQPTSEEREQRYQALLQEINDQLMIRWNQGGFLQSVVENDE